MGHLATKCDAISENHLVFQFKRMRDSEEYDILVKRGGATMVKPPRMSVYTKMDSNLKLESHEVIGKTADFRISDGMIKDRMTSYIEIKLTSQFFVDHKGAERMKFIFTVNRIHPGMLFKNPSKPYFYSLGKPKGEEQEDIPDED